MTCEHRIDVAAYLLDALEPAEADRMRAHLLTCPDCRAEYDELRGLPALLNTLTSADIEEIVAPTELPEDLCDAVIGRIAARRRRRGRRRMLAIAAAAVVLAGGIAAGLVTRPAPAAPPVAAATVSATDPGTHAHANATLTTHDWGTQIRLELTGVPWGERCMLIVNSADGQHDTAATWVADYRGFLDITGTTAIPTDQIRRMDVVTTSGARLVELLPHR